MPIRDVIITDSSGIVVLRRSYGSLPPEKIEATASIVNLITPLMEQVSRTDVGKVVLGSQYLTFKRAGDFLFIVFSDKDVREEVAEAICHDVSAKFLAKYEKNQENVREFRREVDSTVLTNIGLKKFVPGFFIGTSGVKFIAYAEEGEWSVSGADVREVCKELENVRSMSLGREAVLKVETKLGPVLVAPIARGMLFLGIDEGKADLDLLFEKIKEIRDIVSESRRLSLYIPQKLKELYEKTLNLYLLLYEDGERVLRRDLNYLREKGMDLEEALKKLFEEAQSQI